MTILEMLECEVANADQLAENLKGVRQEMHGSEPVHGDQPALAALAVALAKLAEAQHRLAQETGAMLETLRPLIPRSDRRTFN